MDRAAMEDFMDSLVKEVEGNIKPIRAVKMDDFDDVQKNTHTKNKQPVFQKLSDTEEDEPAPVKAPASRPGRTSRRTEQAGKKKRLQPIFEKEAEPSEYAEAPKRTSGPPEYAEAPKRTSRQPVYAEAPKQTPKRPVFAPDPEPVYQRPVYDDQPGPGVQPPVYQTAPAPPPQPAYMPAPEPQQPLYAPHPESQQPLYSRAPEPPAAPGYAPAAPGIPSAIPGMPPVAPASPVTDPAAARPAEALSVSETASDTPARPPANPVPMMDGDKDIFTHVHRENVKCYRNTQATLVENSNQIRQGLEEVHTNIHGWLLGLLIISIINFGANALLILHMIFGFL